MHKLVLYDLNSESAFKLLQHFMVQLSSMEDTGRGLYGLEIDALTATI